MLVEVHALEAVAHVAALGAVTHHVLLIRLAFTFFLPVIAMFSSVSALSDWRSRRRSCYRGVICTFEM